MRTRATTQPHSTTHRASRGTNFRHRHHPGERPGMYNPGREREIKVGRKEFPKWCSTAEGVDIRLKLVHQAAMQRIAEKCSGEVPAHGSIETMSEGLMSRPTWIKVTRDLEALDTMTIERRGDRHGNLVNVYVPKRHALWEVHPQRVLLCKPKSKNADKFPDTSLTSVGESVIQTPEERPDEKPEPVKAENDPVAIDLTGVPIPAEPELTALGRFVWRETEVVLE